MISHLHRCIFVRISKTASTSILNAFSAISDVETDGEFEKVHFPIKHYQDTYPDLFNQYFKFGFVRNPWQRIYSQYRYLRFILKKDHAQCSFPEWLSKSVDALNNGGFLFGRDRDIFLLHMTNQLDWLSIDGTLSVDFIGRFERIDADMNAVSRRLGVNLTLDHKNSSGAYIDYRREYDDVSAGIVAKLHKKDIDYFGYAF